MLNPPGRDALVRWLMGADEGRDRSGYGTDSPNADPGFEFGNEQTGARRSSPDPSTDTPEVYYTELMEYARGEGPSWIDDLFDDRPGHPAIPTDDSPHSPSPPADDGANSGGETEPSPIISVADQSSEGDEPRTFGGSDPQPAADRSEYDGDGESADSGADPSPNDRLSTAVQASRDRIDELESSIVGAVDEPGIESAVASVVATSGPDEKFEIRGPEDHPDLHESIAAVRQAQRRIEAGVEQATGAR